MAVITPEGTEVITSKTEIDRLLVQYAMDELYIQPEEIADKCKQSQFEYLLSCIYKTLFKPKDLKAGYDHSNIQTLNLYNFDVLNNLLDIYIELCQKYNKILSITGYRSLTGVDIDVIYQWLYNPGNTESYRLAKKVYSFREQGITNRLLDSKNPIAQVAVANKEFAWDGRIVQAQAEQTKARLTVDKLPELAPESLEHSQIAQSEKGAGIASNQYIER